VHGVLPRFPFLAQPAHGFPQAHGQRGDRFEAQFSAVREFAVLFPVNLCQQELRISQNPRQRIMRSVSGNPSESIHKSIHSVKSLPTWQVLAQPDQLQAIFGIFAIIFGVNPSVSIAAL
jgi:hypothetical protein